MSWLAAPDPFTFGAHVVPMDDDREHVLSKRCWCCPYLDPDGDGLVWIHPALDGREVHEGPYGKPLH